MDKAELKDLLIASGVFMVVLGLWMLYVMLTGYPWWFNNLQKINWMVYSAMLCGTGISILILMRLKKTK